uniref:Uncharacterized protein n=1 Tax=Ditylenchus dipsaci TaxID=166011 RepID=A0A915CTT4_9BILA
MECELRCCFEIHLLRAFSSPLNQTNVSPILRSLFFASNSERIKKFLNETVVTNSWRIFPSRLLEYMKDSFWMPLSICIDFSHKSRLSGANLSQCKSFGRRISLLPACRVHEANLKKTGEENEHLGNICIIGQEEEQEKGESQPVSVSFELPKDSTPVASIKSRSSNGSTSTGLVFKSRSILNASLVPSSVARRKAKRKIEFNGFSNAAKKGQMEEPQDS